jgi:outer membrane protein W
MSRSFTKIVVSAFVLTFVFGVARTSFAQEDNIIHPITKQGSMAMIFELAGIGTFGFTGPGIMGYNAMPAVGAKYFISDDMALFVLAGLTTSSGNDSTPSTVSAKQSSTAFGIAAGFQMHTRPLYSTSPYWGAMVSFGSYSADNGGTSGTDGTDEKRSSSAFGVAALAGFDWFFTHGLSLGGEVSLGFKSTSASTTVGGTTNDDQGTTVIALATNASVHLNVFF